VTLKNGTSTSRSLLKVPKVAAHIREVAGSRADVGRWGKGTDFRIVSLLEKYRKYFKDRHKRRPVDLDPCGLGRRGGRGPNHFMDVLLYLKGEAEGKQGQKKK